MKVIPTATTKREIEKRNSSVQSYPQRFSEMPNDSVSFGASPKKGILEAVKDIIIWPFKKIEEKGFLAEFLIIDTFSMIIPRILVGLNRDKEKTGKTNYKAGIEEAGREVVSGPSMFAIPIGIAYFIQKSKPAVRVPEKIMNIFSESLSSFVNTAKEAVDLTDKKVLDKGLANKLFDKAIADYDKDASEPFRTEFVNSITNPETKTSDFEKIIKKLNNSNTKNNTLDAKSISLGGKNELSASDLLGDFRHYSKDVVEKLSKNKLTGAPFDKCKKEAVGFLENLSLSRNVLRKRMAIGSFFAVGAFLLILPKLYQQGKLSPAEESANRASTSVKGGANEN